MDDDKIVLDRKSFEALAVDTRVRILKSLKERRKTLTEIATEQSMSVSGIKEHLATLEKVELIEKIDDGHKWKYYELTKKGRDIIGPREVRVWILLSLSTFALITSIFMIFTAPSPLTHDIAASPDVLTSLDPGYNRISGSGMEGQVAAVEIIDNTEDAEGDTNSPPQLENEEAEYDVTEGQQYESEEDLIMAIADAENNLPEPNHTTTFYYAETFKEENETKNTTIQSEENVNTQENTIPLIIAGISALVIILCTGILVRNRLKAST